MQATAFNQNLASKEIGDAVAQLHLEHIKVLEAHTDLCHRHDHLMEHIARQQESLERNGTAADRTPAQVTHWHIPVRSFWLCSNPDCATSPRQWNELHKVVEDAMHQKLSSHVSSDAGIHRQLAEARSNSECTKAEHNASSSSYEAAQISALLRKWDPAQQTKAATAERNALVSRIAALEIQVQSHESLESEHEDLLSKYSRLDSEHGLLLADNQQLSIDHSQLTHDHQLLSTQHLKLGEEHQRAVLEQQKKQEELAGAQEQLGALSGQLKSLQQAYGTDLHKLQNEILFLEDRAQSKLFEIKAAEQLQRQLQAQLQQQSDDHLKVVADLRMRLQQASSEKQSLHAKLADVTDKSCGLQLQHADLAGRLQCSQDFTSDLQSSLSRAQHELTQCHQQLSGSHAQCSDLKSELAQSQESDASVQSELAELQADLRRLHDLAASKRISSESLFCIFAEPVSTLDSSSTSVATSKIAADGTTTSNTSSGVGTVDETCTQQLPARADITGIISDDHAWGEKVSAQGDLLYLVMPEAAKPCAAALSDLWRLKQAVCIWGHAILTLLPAHMLLLTNCRCSGAARSLHCQYPASASLFSVLMPGAVCEVLCNSATDCIQAVYSSKADVVVLTSQPKPAATKFDVEEEKSFDEDGTDIPIEVVSEDKRASSIQKQLLTHPNLTLAAALGRLHLSK